MNQFLLGCVVMASLAVGLFFLRYFKATRDRLFLLFSVAFWLLALNWAIAAFDPTLQKYAHVARFLAFFVIAVAVIDKNRRQKA